MASEITMIMQARWTARMSFAASDSPTSRSDADFTLYLVRCVHNAGRAGLIWGQAEQISSANKNDGNSFAQGLS